jgi:hypothetical protein
MAPPTPANPGMLPSGVVQASAALPVAAVPTTPNRLADIPDLVQPPDPVSGPANPMVSDASQKRPASPPTAPVQNPAKMDKPEQLPVVDATAPPTLPKVDKAPPTPGVVVIDQQQDHTASPAVRMVNSKRITINYEVKDVGPSGISGIELWFTQDGKTWKKRDVSSSAKPPYVVEVNEEGLYGFTLLARNGIGLAKEAPQPGDAPMIWVEVDLTNPVVQLTGVNANCVKKTQNVIIHWRATDKNFGPRPITLSYATKEEGPWQTIAAHVPNTGRYVWPLPADAPVRFYVRVEAADVVGNVGMAQTPKPVLMDRSQPTVSILNVEPTAN